MILWYVTYCEYFENGNASTYQYVVQAGSRSSAEDKIKKKHNAKDERPYKITCKEVEFGKYDEFQLVISLT